MNTQAKMVMWIGLFLIVMNMVVNWQTIKSALFSGGSSSGKGGSGGGGGGGGGGFLCTGCVGLPLPLRLACEAYCDAHGNPVPASVIAKGKAA
jgi:hypothetical protein